MIVNYDFTWQTKQSIRNADGWILQSKNRAQLCCIIDDNEVLIDIESMLAADGVPILYIYEESIKDLNAIHLLDTDSMKKFLRHAVGFMGYKCAFI